MTAYRTIAPALLAAFLCASAIAPAQTRPVWIFFRDKGPAETERIRTGSAETFGLSREALERRARAMGYAVRAGASTDELLAAARAQALRKDAAGEQPGPIVDAHDLPVHQAYVDAVRASGASLRATSKWFNAVSVACDEIQLRAIRSLPFVDSTAAVRRWKAAPEPTVPYTPHLRFGKRDTVPPVYKLDYGESLDQLEVINVPRVHDIWIDGTGITVGMLDNGFRWRLHEALQNVAVLGEYDFINKDSLTENETGDPPGQDGHGTITFSALGGWKEGVLLGPAFRASFFLAKTEVDNSETQIEEDYYAQGLEWLESLGCAVTSSSLAYSTWDDSTGYTYANGDFDGQTAVTTRAASRAARLGVTVVTAMGNEGNRPGTIMAPADADSIVSVGAVTFDRTVASFSSNGPTNDGRMKPDVVAPGVGVLSATRSDTASYTRASGTSLATPLAAGVAALVRSARPELTPIQARAALRNTADFATAPDNKHGWGTLDAWKAVLYHGMVISTNPKVVWNGARNIVAAYVVSPWAVNQNTVSLTYAVGGGPDQTLPMVFTEPIAGYPAGSGLYIATFPPLPDSATVRYFIVAVDARESRTSPFGAPDARHLFLSRRSDTSGIPNLVPTKYRLHPSFPNPVVSGQDAFVRYDVPVPGARIRLELHDVLGRLVRMLVDEHRDGGPHLAMLPTRALGTGPYYLSLSAAGNQIVRRMMIVK